MKMIAAEVMEDETKQAAGGRRLRKAEQIAEVVAGYEASGLSMAAYARREKLCYPTFAAWVKKSRSAPLVPRMTFARVELPGRPAAPGLSATLPNGVVLSGGDPMALAALVRELWKA
jgi:hypothetical protein